MQLMVLGQPGFTNNNIVTPPTNASTYYPYDVHPDNNRLFVADSSNNRVLVFDTTVLTDGKSAVSVLGANHVYHPDHGICPKRNE